MKTYLIDGYNLGHKIATVVKFLQQHDFAAAIETIMRTVQQKINARQNRVILVFDGKRGVFERPTFATTIEIRFSRKPQQADDLIRDFLRRATDTSNIIVVSSDQEIVRSARDLGAQVVRSEQFLKLNKSSQSKRMKNAFNEKPDTDNIDLDYWLKQFNRDDEDDA